MASEYAIDWALDAILADEGGFVNHPADRGGPTKFGITRPTLAAARGVSVDEISAADIRDLSPTEARRIIRRLYIEHPKLGELPDRLLQPMADTAVLFGPASAIRMLQQALGRLGHHVAVDGIIGPQTLRAVHAVDPQVLQRMLVVERLARHVEDIHAHPEQLVFARGWLRRAIDLMD